MSTLVAVFVLYICVVFVLNRIHAAAVNPTPARSYLFKSHTTAQNVVLFVNVFCMILMIASLIMSQISSTCRADQSLRYVWRLLPGFSLGNGLIALSFLDELPLIDSTCDVEHGIAVSISSIQPYDALDLRATGTNLIFMACESIVYLVLAILIDVVLSYPRILMRCRKEPRAAISTKPPPPEDEDVAAERTRVHAEIATDTYSDAIVLDGLRKVYRGGKVAVSDLSFGLKVGECFGFLGVNGAGKTTALQCISGDVLPSAGTAKLGGFDVLDDQQKVRRLLGYCPQHDALLELLTAREHLNLYGRIKGITEDRLRAVVDEQLKEFDLVSFANKKAGTLSGGNKRKLSVAIAMIGNPPIVVLDEPSTGQSRMLVVGFHQPALRCARDAMRRA